jgi:hypothetical protein
MKHYILCLALMAFSLMFVHVARAEVEDYIPGEFRLTTYCGVYHFDRNKIRNGRELNETPNCLGGSVGWHVNDTVDAGLIALSFRNSIYKRTVLAGGYIEKDLYQNLKRDGILDFCGIGAALGGQVVKGYDVPVIGDVYGYCEKWRLRANVTVVPPIGSTVDSAVIWTIDLKLWEN